MNMNKPQTWYIGAGVAALLVLVAGWMLLIAPARASADQLAVDTETAQARNAATAGQITQLKEQAKDLPAQQLKIAEVRSRIPENPALPSLIRALSASAKSAGISLDKLTPAVPSLAAPPATSTGAPTVGGGVAPGQVSQIPLQLEITGKYANIRLFMNSIEQLQRSFLVTALSIDRDSSKAPGALKAQIVGRVFMAVPGAAVAPVAAPVPAAGAPAAS